MVKFALYLALMFGLMATIARFVIMIDDIIQGNLNQFLLTKNEILAFSLAILSEIILVIILFIQERRTSKSRR